MDRNDLVRAIRQGIQEFESASSLNISLPQEAQLCRKIADAVEKVDKKAPVSKG